MATLKHLAIVALVRKSIKAFPPVILHFGFEGSDPIAEEILDNLDELGVPILHTIFPTPLVAFPPLVLYSGFSTNEPGVFQELELLDTQRIFVLDYAIGIESDSGDGYSNPMIIRDLIYYWRNYFISGFDPMAVVPTNAPHHGDGHRIRLYAIPHLLHKPDKICPCIW